MDGKFDEKLEIVTAAASKEIEYLFDKGEETFIKEMANETINGLSFMSKPAVLVLKVLHQYGADMMNRHAAEAIELTKKIDGYQQEFSRATKNATKCEVYDAAANKLMEAVNPMVLNFYQNKAEEYRVWLNALATWNWYVAGNPKNTIIVQDMGFTAWLESLYVAAMTEQLVYAPTCKPQKELTPVGITEPAIPNFICPAVVSIPVGADWQQLSKASKNFDNNTSGTKQNTNNPVPNTSISFGIGDMIAQPGKAPFIKTANGSISPGMINSADDELTPLSKIPLDELTPLPKLPKDDDLTPLKKIPLDELTPLPDLRKSKLAKELLKKIMTADCKNVKNSKDKLKEELDRMMKSVKELEAYENVIEQIKKLEKEIEQKEGDGQKKEQLKKQIEKMQQETDKMDKYEQMQQSKKEMEKIMKEMDAMDDKKTYKDNQAKIQQLVDEMEGTLSILQDVKTNSLQPSISSGVQGPGTTTPVKGLFK